MLKKIITMSDMDKIIKKHAFTLAEPQSGIELSRPKAQKAFTLAEVLITLAVIGVVAAMSIPSLMVNIQETKMKSKWRKSYSTIENAMRKLYQENGGSLRGLYSNTLADGNQIRDDLSQYLNIIKFCDATESRGICWSDGTLSYRGLVSDGDKGSSGASAIVLNDGICINFVTTSSCGFPIDGISGRDPVCARINIDVNCLDGPNQMGKDVFRVWVQEDRIKPSGSSELFNEGYPACEVTSSSWGGFTCSAKYLIE